MVTATLRVFYRPLGEADSEQTVFLDLVAADYQDAKQKRDIVYTAGVPSGLSGGEPARILPAQIVGVAIGLQCDHCKIDLGMPDTTEVGELVAE